VSSGTLSSGAQSRAHEFLHCDSLRIANVATVCGVPGPARSARDATINDTGKAGPDGLKSASVTRRAHPQPCRWCGRDVTDAGMGRRRQYCRRSCRQRAYEQRALITRGAAGPSLALPADAVVLSADDAADLSDRVYQVRCAAEDVATALDEGAAATELRDLCEVLMRAARAADGWRRVGV
jgi:hypothetical protein